ncbi:MAG: tetraacyldisaccharide 4'-kinase [Verrucomicrobia bacterium]|nr:tetraacyldisaccharide 4'-kinase [Verrucomicrobiota bacterium]
MPLESYVIDIMEGRRRGKFLLRALSYLYQAGVRLRNQAYDLGLLAAHDAGLPVISVGNIVAGGTGKTPFVKLLAQKLSSDFRVAILSRGYRSAVEKTEKNLLVEPGTPPSECGDEPSWLARVLPHVQVWVGKNRLKSAQLAQQKGAEILLMDDGMQHRQLKRDFEIVLVDGEDPFGKGFFLPRGLLRDAPQRLRTADCVVAIDPSEQIEEQLRLFTRAPIVHARRISELSLNEKKVAVFCAIGNPQRFLKSVREAGGAIIATFFKPDHDPFTAEELRSFAKESGAEALVCTEKDHVKLPADFQCAIPVIPFPSHLEIINNTRAWEQLLNKIQSKIRVQHDRRISSHAS